MGPSWYNIHAAFFKPNKLSFCISVFSLSTSLLICFVKIFLKFWVNLFHRDWRFKGPKFQTKPFFFLLYNLQCFIMRLTFPLVENLGLDLILRGAAKFFSTFAKIFLHFCFKLSSWPELGCWSPTPISFQKKSGRNPKTGQNPQIPGRIPKKNLLHFLPLLLARIGVPISHHPNIHCWLPWYQMIYPSHPARGVQRWSIFNISPAPPTKT